MRELPSGTVTFLFTDMAGSTALLKELGPEGYASELAEHRRIVREACAGSNGVEVDTQGDAFFFAFERAADAVAAALAVQEGLAVGPAPARIGLHTGEPLVTAEGYVGMDVNRAARIAAAGHGGQVLVSRVTQALVPDADYVDLGDQRLKDLAGPERLYQLGSQEFPPLKTLNRTNLPLAAHPLVGRAAEQAELLGLLRERRLVTISGPGGTGKTRLALQVAAELLDEVVDGVFFVNLAELGDPELVVPAVLEALGADAAAPERARGLAVLDNFEHLVEAAAAVARLLREAPDMKLLVTSRTPLRISGEIEVPLEPLPESASVELFLERAQAFQARPRAERDDCPDLRAPRRPAARARARGGAVATARAHGAPRPPRRAAAAADPGRARMAIGHSASDAGECARARDRYEEAIVLSRQLDDEQGVAATLGDLAGLLLLAGQPEEALQVASEALALQRKLGFEQGAALVQAVQGYAFLLTGQRAQARALLMRELDEVVALLTV